MSAKRKHKPVSQGLEEAIKIIGGTSATARAIGVGYSVVARYRSGHLNLPPYNAYKIHTLTKIPFLSLFRDDLIASIDATNKKNKFCLKMSKVINDHINNGGKINDKELNNMLKTYLDQVIAWAMAVGSSI